MNKPIQSGQADIIIGEIVYPKFDIGKGTCIDLVIPKDLDIETLNSVTSKLNEDSFSMKNYSAIPVWGHFSCWEYRIPFWGRKVYSFLNKCEEPIAKRAALEILETSLEHNIFNTGFNVKLIARLAVATKREKAIVFSSQGCDPMGAKLVTRFCSTISEIALPIHLSSNVSWYSNVEQWTSVYPLKTE